MLVNKEKKLIAYNNNWIKNNKLIIIIARDKIEN